MKNLLRVTALVMSLMLIFGLCACRETSDDELSSTVEIQHTTEYIDNTSVENVDNSNTQVSQESSNATVSSTSSEQAPLDNSSVISSQEELDLNLSQKPRVTICAAVSPGVYAVGGVCPIDTEYVRVGGLSITETKSYPQRVKKKVIF